MPALSTSFADDLSQLEAAVLDHLTRVLRPGFCPSREELSRAAGLGGRGYRINHVLSGLEEKGYLELARGRSRAITLLRRADGRTYRAGTLWAPVVGVIGASEPRATAMQTDNPFAGEAIELTRDLVGGRDEVFALRVSGDSMIDALVNDGDVVVLTAVAEIHNGDMVAARIVSDDGHEAMTLKHFYRENGHVRLQAANPRLALNPLPLCRPEQVEVYGKVVLIVRQVG